MTTIPDTQRLLIGGTRRQPAGSTTNTVINPTTEAVITTVRAADTENVAAAVRAARRALPAWAATPANDRAQHLEAIADGLEERAGELTDLIVAELGMPRKLARRIQVELAIGDFRTYAAAAVAMAFERTTGNSVVRSVPIGVVAAITPWNYPLHQIAGKFGGALAAGCTVVLKPSELTPLTAFVLAEVCDSVGLPPGVINLITGPGRTVGRTLVRHPDIDMVSFTGSPTAGAQIAQEAGAELTPAALELGGKSPSVLLADLDEAAFSKAAQSTVSSCFLNSGQTCSGLTRLLVPRTRLEEAEAVVVTAAGTFVLGDPDDPATRMGPVVSAGQRDAVRDYIASGEQEGARLLTGGTQPPAGPDNGYFVQPTVFSGTRPDMRIVQEEIFGPVLVIQAYDDEDDAVALANGTPYSLAGAVFGADLDTARDLAWRLHAGQVAVNGAPFNPAAPFGGFGKSGHGREFGLDGIEEFLTTRSVQMPVPRTPRGPDLSGLPCAP